MKIAYKHLCRMFEAKPSIDDISQKLFQLGHEHELENGIFDIEITPNRGDCLSINGILRDLSIFFEIKDNACTYKENINKLEIDFENNAIDICPKISFLKIVIDKPTNNYKNYLESFFTDLSLNKINFFTDISNYLSYETGQPTHCYDFNEICGKLSFGQSKNNTNFKTLFDQNLELRSSNKDYAFFVNEKVVNLAGIIGGKSTACSKNTKTVLVECAFFEPEAIIGKTINYSIQSEAAYKFERGVDHNIHEYVLRRFIKIVEDHANILNVEMCSFNYKDIKEKELLYNPLNIDKIIGFKIPNIQKKDFLQKLGFLIKKNIIIVPSYRSDIHNLNDISEEIARVIGYDNIPSKSFNIPICNHKNEYTIENNVRSFLISNGFFDVINFPFCGDKEKNSIKVDNPLDSKKAFMRTTLKNSLIENLLFNEKRQKDSIKIFEISDVYYSDNQSKKLLGIIASGRLGRNYRDFSKKIDSKYLENLVRNIVNSKDFNIVEILRNELNSKIKNPIFYAEIDLDLAVFDNLSVFETHLQEKKNFVKYKKISEYPSTFRDISFSVKDPSKISKLEEIFKDINHNLLKDFFIFDYYNNNKLDHIKIGFRLIFQSYEKTLTDNEVDKIMEEIMDKTLTIENVEIPGLIK